MFATIISLFIGWLGMGLTNYLKSKLGWEDKLAVALTALVSLTLAVLQLFVAGQVNPEMFTMANLPGTFGLIFAAATIIYKGLSKTPADVG